MHPERHIKRVAAMVLTSRFRVLGPLWKVSYHDIMVAIELKLTVTSLINSITLTYACAITSLFNWLSMLTRQKLTMVMATPSSRIDSKCINER